MLPELIYMVTISVYNYGYINISKKQIKRIKTAQQFYKIIQHATTKKRVTRSDP